MYSFKLFKKGFCNFFVVENHKIFQICDGRFSNIETPIHDPNWFARIIFVSHWPKIHSL